MGGAVRNRRNVGFTVFMSDVKLERHSMNIQTLLFAIQTLGLPL